MTFVTKDKFELDEFRIEGINEQNERDRRFRFIPVNWFRLPTLSDSRSSPSARRSEGSPLPGGEKGCGRRVRGPCQCAMPSS